jgi:membrane protein YdbS with pleckstrin-like domain
MADDPPTRPEEPEYGDEPSRRRRDGWSGDDFPFDDDDTQVMGRASVPGAEPPPADPEIELPPIEIEIDPEELAGLHDGGNTQAAVRRVLPLEDEASALVARYLFPTERYRGEWRRHPIHLLMPMTIGVVATLGLGWLSGLLSRWDAVTWPTWVVVLIWLGVMGYVGWQIADWHFDRFILTNKRVMKVNGIITRNVAMMPLVRVTDMKYEQTPLGRILNYGTFVIESAGQDQALRVVPHLPNPNELYLRVVEEMYEPAAVEARMGGTSDETEEEPQSAGA